ncbi:MAG: Ig domain-containing protein, partial [Clostridia bacterium]|nr:Ig domain-containing protein [Clostridia bacterium]
EPGATDNATATRTCSDPLNTKVTWTSSDESILTVDEEGYFKADKHKTGDVTVTASMEFNGKTYTDECLVRVRVPVESSAMSKRKLTLSPGESYGLSVKVGPAKATIKTVTWHSEDESVAVVDENGNVTAVAPGVVIIYSLTDDEYYKSTCEVTVE